MVDYKWSEILVNGANDTFDFIVDAAKATSKGFCRLAQTYPNNIFTISPATKQLMRWVCDELETPIPQEGIPVPTPVGVYEIKIFMDARSDSTGEITTFSLTFKECNTSPVQGIVEDVRFSIPDQTPPRPFNNTLGGVADIREPDGSAPLQTVGSGGLNIGRFSEWLPDTFRFEIIECNPAPPPVLPDPLSEDIIVNRYDENNNFIEENTYQVFFPVINNEVNFNAILDLGGITLEFSPGGVGVGGGDDGGGGGGLPGGEPRNVFNPNNYTRRFPSGNNDGNEVATEEEQVEAEELEEEIEEGDLYLRVAVTTFPEGGRTQIYRDSLDTDFFAGYVVFNTRDSANNIIQGELNPIRKAINIYPIPEWATGYRAYTVNRAKIKASYFRLPEEN